VKRQPDLQLALTLERVTRLAEPCANAETCREFRAMTEATRRELTTRIARLELELVKAWDAARRVER